VGRTQSARIKAKATTVSQPKTEFQESNLGAKTGPQKVVTQGRLPGEHKQATSIRKPKTEFSRQAKNE